MSSLRQQILDAIKTRLQAITTGNGYTFNLGTHVFFDRDTPFDPSELPAINYRDLGATKGRFTNRRVTNALKVEIDIIMALSATRANLYDALADVYNAINVDDRWGSLAIDTTPVGDTPNFYEHERNESRTIVEITVEYETDKWSI